MIFAAYRPRTYRPKQKSSAPSYPTSGSYSWTTQAWGYIPDRANSYDSPINPSQEEVILSEKSKLTRNPSYSKEDYTICNIGIAILLILPIATGLFIGLNLEDKIAKSPVDKIKPTLENISYSPTNSPIKLDL